MTAHELVTGKAKGLRCAQCDRPAPTDPELLQTWRHSALMTEPVEELLTKMLLCPACLAEDLAGDFEAGPAD